LVVDGFFPSFFRALVYRAITIFPSANAGHVVQAVNSTIFSRQACTRSTATSDQLNHRPDNQPNNPLSATLCEIAATITIPPDKKYIGSFCQRQLNGFCRNP